MVWYFHLFKNFPQFVVIHTVKGFGIVNKAEVDVFLNSLFLVFMAAVTMHGVTTHGAKKYKVWNSLFLEQLESINSSVLSLLSGPSLNISRKFKDILCSGEDEFCWDW